MFELLLVTDNAANMIRAAETGKSPHVKCFAHTLNLAAQRALKLQTVSRLLGRVRRISAYFHRSTKAKHLFEENQRVVLKLTRPLNLITDVTLYFYLLRYFSCQQGEKPLNKEPRKGLFYNVKLNANRKIHIFTIISLKLMKVQNKVSQYLTLFSDIFYLLF